MLNSHRLLQRYWHDARCDPANVRVWYTDRGAPGDISAADGGDIRPEAYYFIVFSAAGEKPVPYHRILLIVYDGEVAFENRKIRGLAGRIAGSSKD